METYGAEKLLAVKERDKNKFQWMNSKEIKYFSPCFFGWCSQSSYEHLFQSG